VAGIVTASERDLRTLAGIVSDDRGDLPREGLALSLLADLTALIRCDHVVFFGLDSTQQGAWFHQRMPGNAGRDDSGDYERVFWHHYWDFEPCWYPDRTPDTRRVIKRSDFYSKRQLRSTGIYTDYFHPVGAEYALMLWLRAGPGQTVRLIFYRDCGPDFSERDRALLTLLRPHLQQAYIDAEHRHRATAPLTSRQLELLRLVATGRTNAQVARWLGVSEGTVRKHLENIYRKLEVSSRTAAVTRAFPDPGEFSGRFSHPGQYIPSPTQPT